MSFNICKSCSCVKSNNKLQNCLREKKARTENFFKKGCETCLHEKMMTKTETV